ncbi:cytochrome P450 [Westerdykella ornata]|uniref:Cytochrome P450 n=1 Tax=Westerdykella ornata TaxID=318751 RepID=A0A6A6J7W5_WESOR|nr:cytochrome P450 [Westerdykella ornata]KAF2271299.1 cytochrome P450 [Westerdykella ornata]
MPSLLIAAGLLLAYVVFFFFFSGPRLPKGFPIIGAKKTDWFPLLQATWRNSFNIAAGINDAYRNHKHNAAIMPVMGLGADTLIMLPSSDSKFISEQEPKVLSLREVIINGLHYRYTLSDKYILTHPLHKKLITTTLTNQVGILLPELANETTVGFESQWGNDTEAFREVNVWDTVGRVIGCATNRVFVGLPNCRDPKLLDAGYAYARSLPVSATLIGWVWEPARPLIARLIALRTRAMERRFAKVLLPEIERRLREYDDKEKSGSSKNDFLQWSIAQAKESGDAEMWKPTTLASRILLMNMVSIHTSSMTFTNVLLDLVSSKPEYIEELRTEVSTVLRESNGVWTKATLARAIKLDSVFRESARLNTSVAVGLRRKVMVKEGITTPSGVHIPYGNVCAVPSLAVLTDETIYPDADKFVPFRFVDQRHNINTGDRPKDHVSSSRLSFYATSTDYLAFGNGRQACPGRFFAACELKLMLAYILMNYDLEMMETRPKGI